MQDEKEMVREEENETPEAPDQEEALKQSEADTETEQEEAAEADKKPRKEKKLFKKDRTAELEAKIAELEQALADQQNQQLTQSFCDVVDAIIAGGGMVGGLGDRFTRVAAAHAVHNGLTVLPQTEKFLHGTKVAYGILVQSALLGQDDVLAQLTGAYQRFHLPTTLAELEVDINNQAEIDKVIAHTLRPVESIHYLPVTLTPDTLRAAFKKVESFKA